MGNDESLNSVNVFESYRPALFKLAYGMLGSAMDAEDVVQEAFVRWHRVTTQETGTVVQSPKTYLWTVVTRLCIGHLRLARTQREAYVGLWLPEPLVDSEDMSPDDTAELAESLSLALVTILERLRPVERAVFLLRQVFDYDYAEIAQIVQRSEENCRQLFRRAQQHLMDHRVRSPVTTEQRDRLTRQFLEACTKGDLDGLIALLAADVALYTDGGGKQSATLRPVVGADNVARFLPGSVRKAPANLSMRIMFVNGQPGIILYAGNVVQGVVGLDISDNHIQGIYIVVNPDKLRAVPPATTNQQDE